MKIGHTGWAVTFLGLTAIGAPTGATAITVDFEGMTVGALYGKNNVNTPVFVPGFGDVDVNCAGFFNCYQEKGLVFGTLWDSASPLSHIHRATGISNGAEYHADSAGIYARAADLGAFNLDALEVRDIAGSKGPNFTIVGFSEAYNPAVVGASAPFASQVALDSIGANGTKVLGDSFSGIKAFWIYYNGYTATPSDGTTWNIVIDDVQVSAVPLPAAAWFMGPALLGMSALGRRKIA